MVTEGRKLLHNHKSKDMTGKVKVEDKRAVKLLKDLENLKETVISEAIKDAEETVLLAKKNVEEMDAVDTGRLQRNIEFKVIKDGLSFESGAIDPETGDNYAPEVHYGLASSGRNSVPRPYLQNAFHTFINKTNQNIIRILKKILKR